MAKKHIEPSNDEHELRGMIMVNEIGARLDACMLFIETKLGVLSDGECTPKDFIKCCKLVAKQF